jgi:hypothetical protein
VAPASAESDTVQSPDSGPFGVTVTVAAAPVMPLPEIETANAVAEAAADVMPPPATAESSATLPLSEDMPTG